MSARSPAQGTEDMIALMVDEMSEWSEGLRLTVTALNGHLLVEASAWVRDDQALQIFDRGTAEVLAQGMTDPRFAGQRIELRTILHGVVDDFEARIIEVPPTPKVSFG